MNHSGHSFRVKKFLSTKLLIAASSFSSSGVVPYQKFSKRAILQMHVCLPVKWFLMLVQGKSGLCRQVLGNARERLEQAERDGVVQEWALQTVLSK